MAEEINTPKVEPGSGFGILGEFGAEALVENQQPTEPTQMTEPTETPTEPVQQATTEPAQPEPTDWFDVAKFNERFGTELKTEDEVKSAISSLSENQEFINRRGYFTELEGILQDLSQYAAQQFGGKEGFAKNFVTEQLSQGRSRAVVDKIVNSEIDKLGELEALALRSQYLSPALADKSEKVVKGLLKKYGVDVDDPDFNPDNVEISDPQQLVQFSLDAADAKAYLKNLVDGVKVPEIKDFKSEIEAKVAEKQRVAAEQAAARQKLSDQWGSKAKELADKLKTIEFKRKDKDGNESVKFTYDVPQDFVKSIIPYLANYAVEQGLDLTQENVAKVEAELVQFVKEEHIDELMDMYANHVSSKVTTDVDNKVHNNKPINQTEAPASHVKTYEDEVNEAFLKQLGGK